MHIPHHFFSQSDQLYLAGLDGITKISDFQVQSSVKYARRLQISMYDLALEDSLVSFDNLFDIHNSFFLIELTFFFYFLSQGAKLTVFCYDKHLLVPGMLRNDLQDVVPSMQLP